MDYLASWLFTTSSHSKNSRFHLRHPGSHPPPRPLQSSAPHSLPLSPPPSPWLANSLPAPPDLAGVSEILEQLAAQVVDAFNQLRLERDATPQSSAQWHKLTGELLAYARVTALLEELRCGPLSSSHSED